MTDTPESVAKIVRKTVSLPAELWDQIDDFRFANRINKEAEAIRRIIVAGLHASRVVGDDRP